jgi:hypothetical protein
MTTAAFTTWSALLQRLLDDLASGSTQVASYTTGDRTVTYTTPAERLRLIEYVRTMAALVVSTARPRTYGGQGGRGGA